MARVQPGYVAIDVVPAAFFMRAPLRSDKNKCFRLSVAAQRH